MANASVSFFSKARNVHVSGGTIAVNNFGGATGDEGLNTLYKNVSRGALHDSGERFDPPRCHPGTRIEILNAMTKWLDDLESPQHTTWLRGAAGAGKSSIAQKFAHMCAERGRLSGSFFFSRANGTGRGDDKRLIATLAYQLYQNLPESRSTISSTILNNPMVFDLTLEAQIEKLIISPLLYVDGLRSVWERPRLIVIDGLDECENTQGAQERIIRTFISALSHIQHKLPHKLLISSRPETNIKATFNSNEVNGKFSEISLDDVDLWGAYNDVRVFLVGSFAEIVQTHPLALRRSSTFPPDWPPVADIETLVEKSSGKFIYPHVVMAYIKSPKHDPRERLKVVLGLVTDNRANPYAMLDALYSHIFSCVQNLDLVLGILCIKLYSNGDGEGASRLTEDFISIAAMVLFEISKDDFYLAFDDLSSIIEISRFSEIHFLHASLTDFLVDEARSGQYFVRREPICLDFAQRCLKFISGDNIPVQDMSIYYRDMLLFCLQTPMVLAMWQCNQVGPRLDR